MRQLVFHFSLVVCKGEVNFIGTRKLLIDAIGYDHLLVEIEIILFDVPAKGLINNRIMHSIEMFPQQNHLIVNKLSAVELRREHRHLVRGD